MKGTIASKANAWVHASMPCGVSLDGSDFRGFKPMACLTQITKAAKGSAPHVRGCSPAGKGRVGIYPIRLIEKINNYNRLRELAPEFTQFC